MSLDLIDIGANLTHDSFAEDRDAVMTRALQAGVRRLVVTGADLARGLPTQEQRGMFMKTAVMLTYADGNVSDKERRGLTKLHL